MNCPNSGKFLKKIDLSKPKSLEECAESIRGLIQYKCTDEKCLVDEEGDNQW